jgi:hypothetical protein
MLRSKFTTPSRLLIYRLPIFDETAIHIFYTLDVDISSVSTIFLRRLDRLFSGTT